MKHNWAWPWENVSYVIYANNEGADHPAHPRSLISAFVVCCLDGIISLDSIAEISSLLLASVAAGRFVSGLVGNSRKQVFSWRSLLEMESPGLGTCTHAHCFFFVFFFVLFFFVVFFLFCFFVLFCFVCLFFVFVFFFFVFFVVFFCFLLLFFFFCCCLFVRTWTVFMMSKSPRLIREP